MKKIPLILMTVLFITTCKNHSVDPTSMDEISGVYFLEGLKITFLTLSESETEDVTVDTTYFALPTKVLEDFDKKDTLQFIGLEGADVGKNGNRVYPDCSVPDECKIYASLTGEIVEINLSNNGRTYKAQGSLRIRNKPIIELESEFRYQNLRIQYFLSGVPKPD